jgi:hypothetical protein
MMNENDLRSMEECQKVKREIENQDAKLQEKLEKRKTKQMYSKSVSNLLDDT